MGDEERKPPPRAGKGDRKDDDAGLPLGLILVGLLAAYGLLFILFNSDQVNVSFVFFEALLITAGIGFAAGYYLREIRARRRARRSSS